MPLSASTFSRPASRRSLFVSLCLLLLGVAPAWGQNSGVLAQGNADAAGDGAVEEGAVEEGPSEDATTEEEPAEGDADSGSEGAGSEGSGQEGSAGEEAAGDSGEAQGTSDEQSGDQAASDETAGPSEEDELLGDEDLFSIGDEEHGEEEAVGEDADEGEGQGEEDEAALEEESLYELRDLVVAYTPEDVLRLGGSAQLLGEEQLSTLEYDDPHSVLLQVPGVYVRTEDGFGLRPNIGLRGGNPERSKKVTLMEDGVLFGPAPYSAPAAYYFPLMARMTGVEVFKGPSALLYGPQTIGGAINLRTREVPSASEGAIDLSFGLYQSRKMHFHWGTSGRHFGLLVEALDVGSEGFKDIDGSSVNTGFGRTDFMIRSFAQTNPEARIFSRFDLKLGFGRERSNETYLGLSEADFEQSPYRRYAASELDRMTWWRTQVQLDWRLDIGEDLSFLTSVYRHDFDRSWVRLNRFAGGSSSLFAILDNPTGRRRTFLDILRGDQDSSNPDENLLVVDNSRRFVSQGIQTVARWDGQTGAVGHNLEVGLRAHYDSIERHHQEVGYAMTSGRLVADGIARDPLTINEGTAFAFSGYLVWGLEFHGLTLSPGIRGEVIHTTFRDELAAPEDREQSNTRGVFLPGIGAHYAITEAFGVLAGVHRGFSPVAPGQAANVEEEQSINYELGVRYSKPNEAQLLELVGFLNDYSNLAGQCAFSSGCTPDMLDRQFNAGRVLVWGAEAAANWTFELGNAFELPLRASYTYTGSRFQESFESEDPTFGDVEEGDSLPYLPEHQAQVQVGFAHPRGGLRTVATYSGRMRELASSGSGDDVTFTDDYLMLDAVAWFHPVEALKTYIRFENLLQAQPIVSRRPFGARTVRPFSVIGGVEANF